MADSSANVQVTSLSEGQLDNDSIDLQYEQFMDILMQSTQAVSIGDEKDENKTVISDSEGIHSNMNNGHLQVGSSNISLIDSKVTEVSTESRSTQPGTIGACVRTNEDETDVIDGMLVNSRKDSGEDKTDVIGGMLVSKDAGEDETGVIDEMLVSSRKEAGEDDTGVIDSMLVNSRKDTENEHQSLLPDDGAVLSTSENDRVVVLEGATVEDGSVAVGVTESVPSGSACKNEYLKGLWKYKMNRDIADRVQGLVMREKNFPTSTDGCCPNCRHPNNQFIILDFLFSADDMPEILKHLLKEEKAVLWSVIESNMPKYVDDPPTFLCGGSCPRDTIRRSAFNLDWSKTNLEKIYSIPDGGVEVEKKSLTIAEEGTDKQASVKAGVAVEKVNQEQEGTNLYVCGLPLYVDNHELLRLFQPFGSIRNSVVMLTSAHESRGIGFVDFLRVCDAKAAITGMSGKRIGRSMLIVKFAAKQKTLKETKWKPNQRIVMKSPPTKESCMVIKESPAQQSCVPNEEPPAQQNCMLKLMSERSKKKLKQGKAPVSNTEAKQVSDMLKSKATSIKGMKTLKISHRHKRKFASDDKDLNLKRICEHENQSPVEVISRKVSKKKKKLKSIIRKNSEIAEIDTSTKPSTIQDATEPPDTEAEPKKIRKHRLKKEKKKAKRKSSPKEISIDSLTPSDTEHEAPTGGSLVDFRADMHYYQNLVLDRAWEVLDEECDVENDVSEVEQNSMICSMLAQSEARKDLENGMLKKWTVETKSRLRSLSRSQSRSRSRSSKTRSRSRNRSRSWSYNRSRLRSRSRSKLSTRPRTRSKSRSKLRSHSKSRTRSRNRSNSKNRSTLRSQSRSRSRARSKSVSRSASFSRSRRVSPKLALIPPVMKRKKKKRKRLAPNVKIGMRTIKPVREGGQKLELPISKNGNCPFCESKSVEYIILEDTEDETKPLPELLARMERDGYASRMKKGPINISSFHCKNCTYGFNLDWSCTDLESIFYPPPTPDMPSKTNQKSTANQNQQANTEVAQKKKPKKKKAEDSENYFASGQQQFPFVNPWCMGMPPMFLPDYQMNYTGYDPYNQGYYGYGSLDVTMSQSYSIDYKFNGEAAEDGQIEGIQQEGTQQEGTQQEETQQEETQQEETQQEETEQEETQQENGQALVENVEEEQVLPNSEEFDAKENTEAAPEVINNQKQIPADDKQEMVVVQPPCCERVDMDVDSSNNEAEEEVLTNDANLHKVDEELPNEKGRKQRKGVKRNKRTRQTRKNPPRKSSSLSNKEAPVSSVMSDANDTSLPITSSATSAADDASLTVVSSVTSATDNASLIVPSSVTNVVDDAVVSSVKSAADDASLTTASSVVSAADDVSLTIVSSVMTADSAASANASESHAISSSIVTSTTRRATRRAKGQAIETTLDVAMKTALNGKDGVSSTSESIKSSRTDPPSKPTRSRKKK